MKISFFPDYVLDDTSNVDTSDSNTGINDNDDKNYNYDSKENNEGNHFNNNNDDDYDNKYDNGNDNQTIVISHKRIF